MCNTVIMSNKTWAICGIALSGFGLLGAFMLFIDGDSDGWYALLVYAFFLAESLVFKKSIK